MIPDDLGPRIFAALVLFAAATVSSLSAAVGQVIASATFSTGTITAAVFFFGTILVGVIGWTTVTLYKVSNDTSAMREGMTDTRQDISEIKGRLDALERPKV